MVKFHRFDKKRNCSQIVRNLIQSKRVSKIFHTYLHFFFSPKTVAPQKPKLEHEGQHILPGNNVTVDSGATATVKCVSHYGNPPAVLKWFLGDQEIAPLHPQANSTEPDNPRTWSAASVVQIPATKERHGLLLKCLAFHEYYSARTVGVEARMDVRCKLNPFVLAFIFIYHVLSIFAAIFFSISLFNHRTQTVLHVVTVA